MSTASLIESPAIEWLAELYGAAEAGWLTLFAQDRTSDARQTRWRPVDQLDALASDAAALATTSCVWFGVGIRRERTTGRGTANDVTSFPGLWLDIDVAEAGWHKRTDLPPTIDDARALLDDFPLPPSAVVHTGGGLQAWWLFDELQTAEDVAPILERWAITWQDLASRREWHIDSVFDAARVMRLPGTWNRKGKDPVPVDVIARSGHRYGLDDVEQWLMEIPRRPTPLEQPRTPYVGPARPGDAFNLTHRGGADLLVASGFVLHHRDLNGDEHYTGPWKTTREGASATVYADDGHTTIWSDTALQRWPSLEVRRPYDPFGLYAHLHHAGDFTAASDELARRGYGTKAVRTDLSWATDPAANVAERVEPKERTWPRATRADIASILSGDYDPPRPSILRRTDGEALLYPGRVHTLSGEPGACKTWIAQVAMGEILDAGGTVMFLDHEDNLQRAVWRLNRIGADHDGILDRFDYSNPTITIKGGGVPSDVLEDAWRCELVVIDSFGEGLAHAQLDQNDDGHVAAYMERVARRIAEGGPTVVLLDHVTKDKEGRGRWAIGSQRKLAAVDGVAYSVEVIKPLDQEHDGKVKLVCSKDRGGTYMQGTTVAIVDLKPRSDRLHITISPDDSHDETGEFMPTVLMERVSRYLEEADEGLTSRTILDAVKGRDGDLRLALAKLVELEFVAVEKGARGARLHRSARPFRHDGDGSIHSTAAPRPTAAHRGRAAVESSAAPAPLPEGAGPRSTGSQDHLETPHRGPDRIPLI